jgi:hypothetical protein
MIKSPLPESVALLEKVHECLGPNRLPLLIAIDGADGVGKSSLASWLAWQLGAPAVYLDLYVIRDSNPLRWRTDELRRIVNRRLVDHAAPLVVEGIMCQLAVLNNLHPGARCGSAHDRPSRGQACSTVAMGR